MAQGGHHGLRQSRHQQGDKRRPLAGPASTRQRGLGRAAFLRSVRNLVRGRLLGDYFTSRRTAAGTRRATRGTRIALGGAGSWLTSRSRFAASGSGSTASGLPSAATRTAILPAAKQSTTAIATAATLTMASTTITVACFLTTTTAGEQTATAATATTARSCFLLATQQANSDHRDKHGDPKHYLAIHPNLLVCGRNPVFGNPPPRSCHKVASSPRRRQQTRPGAQPVNFPHPAHLSGQGPVHLFRIDKLHALESLGG